MSPPPDRPTGRGSGSASLALRLAGLRRRATPSLSLGEAVTHLAGQSSMLVLLIAGAAAVVPSPGLPVGLVFGTVAALMAARLACGDDSPPTLPGCIARRRLTRPFLDRVSRSLVPLLRRIERAGRPRLRGLATGLGARLACAMIVVQSVLVALPIPFGNSIPGLAILVLALGLARRDGAVTLAGHAIAIGACAFATAVIGAALGGLRMLF